MLGSPGLWGGRGQGQGAPSGLGSDPHALATLCFNSLLSPSGELVAQVRWYWAGVINLVLASL